MNYELYDILTIENEKYIISSMVIENNTIYYLLLEIDDDENLNPENAKIILKKVEMIFGRQMKLSEITEDQVDLFNLVLLDMRDLKDSILNEKKDQ